MTKSPNSAELSLPLTARSLLPHRPPMLFVRSLTRRYDNRASALARLPTAGICVSKGRLLPEYFIELMAQTIAMANGYDALCAGQKMHDGMLVGIDSFSFYGQPILGRMVRIEAEEVFEFEAIRIVHGEVYDGDELLASGDIKVWKALSNDEIP